MLIFIVVAVVAILVWRRWWRAVAATVCGIAGAVAGFLIANLLGQWIVGGPIGFVVGVLAGLLAFTAMKRARNPKVAIRFAVLASVVALGALSFLVGHSMQAESVQNQRSADQSDVAAQLLSMDNFGAPQSSAALFSKTQEFVRLLTKARSDGVSRAWIDSEIADVAGYAPGWDRCHRCQTTLNSVR